MVLIEKYCCFVSRWNEMMRTGMDERSEPIAYTESINWKEKNFIPNLYKTLYYTKALVY